MFPPVGETGQPSLYRVWEKGGELPYAKSQFSSNRDVFALRRKPFCKGKQGGHTAKF